MRKLQRLLAPWRHYTGSSPGLGIPFVDYARGDGVIIGPGHDHQWTQVRIDDDTPWVRDYRGLWGLDTHDRFGGERAPSGPRYERDGSVRTSWSNPVGWAGLQKIPPHDDDLAVALHKRTAELDSEVRELDATIEANRAALRGLRAEALSLSAHDYAQALAKRRMAEVAHREVELNQTIATRTMLAEERRTHLATLSQPPPAKPPQAHITKPHTPYLQEQERRTRFLKLWAAVSTPLLLSSIIVVLLASPLAWITTLAVLIVAFAGVEAIARRLLSFVASVLLLTAAAGVIVALTLLFITHWRTAISVLVGAAALVLSFGNVDELRRS